MPAPSILRRLMIFGFGLWLCSLAAITATQILWKPRSAPQADAIVCLGAGMLSDTSPLAGPGSARRAQTCAALFQAGSAPVVIFTGEGHEHGSAADAMAAVARDAGVPIEALRIEPLAGSTIQNAAFSRALLPENSQSVILVSDAFHLPRAYVIFRALGYDDVTLYPTETRDLSNAFRWCLRESVAIWFNLWRASLYGLGGLAGIEPETRLSWFD